MLNFQDMIFRLTEFWIAQGCVAHQGYDLEVGAGTFNPVTFLRALGPEPYSAVYVEPSRRPQDGRYGDNPNRLQHYHQMQVIIKPSPSNILELYIDSLKAIGLDLKEHDIRFVHDDWENPTIGAAGLGWEVWLDGMEITQFTYFQMIGGIPVKPCSGEITYGLERLAMYLQGVNSIFEIRWSDSLLYGEIFKRSEFEWSRYNFEESDVKMWHRHFDDFEKEAKRLIAIPLPLPAYDFIMKASHAFNMMEARGIISVTERTGYIGRIRSLAKELAEAHSALRKELGYPLLKEKKIEEAKKSSSLSFDGDGKGNFLFEIGSEELPASFVPIGLASLEKEMKELLEHHFIPFKSLKVYGTPRRLAVFVEGLEAKTPLKKIEKKGPPLSLAFNSQGEATEVAFSFFKSLGMDPLTLDELKKGKHHVTLRTFKNQEYLFAEMEKPQESTKKILATALPKLIASLYFPKKMRWSEGDEEYARPIRWLVSLFNDEVIPFTFAHVTADRVTFGHRQIAPQAIVLSHADDYVNNLRKAHVLVDIEERKKSILSQIEEIEKQDHIKVHSQGKVLSQVLHLVEWPFVIKAHFDPAYLKVPQEVLISEMIEHQKYFPLMGREGQLVSEFLIVANNFPSLKIAEGNMRALTPRLADGLFLYQQDLATPFEEFNEKLKKVIFQKELGSVYAKALRMEAIASYLQERLKISSKERVKQAALLSKTDLSCELVKEFPDLQGIIGREYALKSGYEREVADALLEQWMPKGEGAPLPSTETGILISLSDKIDNLLSCFSLNLLPTSSSDPYALRRQTIGMIRILLENKLHLPWLETFSSALQLFLENRELDPKKREEIIAKKETLLSQLEEFFKSRLKNQFEAEGFKKDEIEAVLSGKIDDIYETYRLLVALQNFRNKFHEEFLKALTVYTRTKKILHSQNKSLNQLPPLNKNLLQEEHEKILFHAMDEKKNALLSLKGNTKDWNQVFFWIAELEHPLSQMFDHVTILHEDPKLLQNRLSLLQEVCKFCEQILDFSKIQEHAFAKIA